MDTCDIMMDDNYIANTNDKDVVVEDEWQRLYQRAIMEREYLPIRGKWAISVRKNKERKKKEREDRHNKMRTANL